MKASLLLAAVLAGAGLTACGKSESPTAPAAPVAATPGDVTGAGASGSTVAYK